MELFAATSFGRTPPRFTLRWYQIGTSGCGPPSPSCGWRSPSRCVPSSGARRRVGASSGPSRREPGAPRHRLSPLPSGQPTLRSHRISRSPSRDRAACDSELLIRCSKRLGLTPWSPSVVALRSEARLPSRALSLWASAAVHVSGFRRRPSASPRSAKQALRLTRRPSTRHTRTRLCHRTHPLVQPYLFVFASAPIPKCRCAMSPQCVRSCEGSPGCPRERRRAWRIHAVRPTGPRLFRRHVE